MLHATRRVRKERMSVTAWFCKANVAMRKGVDCMLAVRGAEVLHPNRRRGIAPAMYTTCEATYWGDCPDGGIDHDVERIRGQSFDWPNDPGAKEILDEAWNANTAARQ